MNYYAGDVTKLSDAEIDTLIREIEDGLSGIDDVYLYPEESWERQADRRHDALRHEKRRRWELANPEEAERQRIANKPMADMLAVQIEHYRKGMLDHFEKSFIFRDLILKS